MSSAVVFVCVSETTPPPYGRVWEVALIVRSEGQPDHEYTRFVRLADLDLGNADLLTLEISRFYERHPQNATPPSHSKSLPKSVATEAEVLADVERLSRGASFVGAVPSLDAEVLAARMRANGILPPWRHELMDVLSLARGYLLGRGEYPDKRDDTDDEEWATEFARRLGVEPPDEDHPAALLLEARWVRAIYDKVCGVDIGRRTEAAGEQAPER